MRPTRRGTVYLRCALATTDRRFARYPTLPVTRCSGYAQAQHAAAVGDSAMEQFAREDIRAVLASYGVSSARRATSTGVSEQVVLLAQADFASVDVRALTLALMDALPHTQVRVVEDHPRWVSEPI